MGDCPLPSYTTQSNCIKLKKKTCDIGLLLITRPFFLWGSILSAVWTTRRFHDRTRAAFPVLGTMFLKVLSNESFGPVRILPLDEVLQTFEVGEIFFPTINGDNIEAPAFLETAVLTNLPYRYKQFIS